MHHVRSGNRLSTLWIQDRRNYFSLLRTLFIFLRLIIISHTKQAVLQKSIIVLVPKDLTGDMTALALLLAWCRFGARPSAVVMMTKHMATPGLTGLNQ